MINGELELYGFFNSRNIRIKYFVNNLFAMFVVDQGIFIVYTLLKLLLLSRISCVHLNITFIYFLHK